ncbi:ABC transporter permease [Pseudokineococcus sp. 1T1Z-3]|uniref:ABC transporter permease n=1 Tax=Pseudokineococcus sp. 1T1Z-3 TaxID=3132745 RepID=UPI003097AA15
MSSGITPPPGAGASGGAPDDRLQDDPPGTPAELALEPEGEDERGTSLWRGAWRRLRRDPGAIVGVVIVGLFVLVALLAPVIAPYEPAGAQWASQVTPSSVPGPSDDHLLGLDSFGSDLFTQLVYGARQSLVIGVVSTAIGLVFGAALGVLAGAFGGWVDTAVMRVVDILLSIPSLLLAVSVAAVVGPSPTALMIAIGAAQVPIFARLLRGSMLGQRGADYVLAASSLGLRHRTVVMSHVLPNSLGPVIVQGTLTLATAIIEVAALSYLGLGDPNPTVAEWGRMLVRAQDRLATDPHLAILPGVCIAVSALGFTLFGEALRESLDPKLRR